MKIVHICDFLYRNGWGYQENHLSYYHKKLGHDVTIISVSLSLDQKTKQVVFCEPGEYIDQNGIKVIQRGFKFNIQSTILCKLGLYKDLYHLLAAEKPDVIFRHNCEGMSLNDVLTYKKTHLNVKIFIDSHSDFTNISKKWWVKSLFYKFLWKYNIHKIEPYVEKFYGVLPVRVDFLHEIYGVPKNKIELLLMGANDEAVSAARSDDVRYSLRKKYEIEENDFLIMTGGKIDHFKTQTILLMEAVKRFPNNIRLIIFGSVENSLREKFEKLVDKKQIQYIGWLDAALIYKYFYAADLVVFPGYHSVMWEEAVGLGVPTVFKYIQGATHIDLGGNCKFIHQDSIESIAKVLHEIIDHEDVYQHMKKIAEEKGMKRFSYKEIAAQSIQLFN